MPYCSQRFVSCEGRISYGVRGRNDSANESARWLCASLFTEGSTLVVIVVLDRLELGARSVVFHELLQRATDKYYF